jgi:hypothetical protein
LNKTFTEFELGALKMSEKYPVIIYGASGYTGRLIAEFMRDQQIPFIAAGRNKERVEESMKLVPGIENAEYEVAAVEHSVEALSELFSGATVVCNTVGPFDKFGDATVQACLNAGVHYLDTTGEQAWVLKVREQYGARFADKGLLVAPSVAYMHTVCEIAGEICKEYTDIDTLDFTCIPTGVPTVASTQTIFDMLSSNEYFLEHGQLQEWAAAKAYEVTSPNASQTVLSLPWSGAALPIWYQNDSKIRSVKSLTGFTNRALMEGVVAIAQHYEANLKDLPMEEQKQALSDMASQQQPGMPPRENGFVHRCVDQCVGTGGLNHVTATIYSPRAYQQTGLIPAFAAKQLIGGPLKATGFQSACQAFGYDVLLSTLKGYGFVRVAVEES